MLIRTKVDIKTYPWAVRRALEDMQPKTLMEAGRLTMRVARGFVRQVKNPNVASASGRPPHSHTYTKKKSGEKNKGFKNTITYALRPDKKAVWIGPQKVIGGLSNFAPTHEFGGQRKIVKGDPDLLNGVKIGDIAPITMKYFYGSLDKIQKKDRNVDPKTGRKVVWVRIRTKSQAQHSTRLYNRMVKAYHPYGYTLGKYPARPFMKPSLYAVLPRLPYFWKGVIRG